MLLGEGFARLRTDFRMHGDRKSAFGWFRSGNPLLPASAIELSASNLEADHPLCNSIVSERHLAD